MRILTILLLLLFASSAYGELTKEDLRTIIKEEVRPIIKEEITASEKRTREYIDLKIDAVNTRIDAVNTRIDALENNLNTRIDAVNTRIDALENNLNTRIDAVDKSLGRVWLMIAALIGLITATIAIPQIIIAYRDRSRKEMESSQQAMQSQIDQLRAQIEAMQNTSS